ncbi:hypothetical protein [Pseudochrobactrum sp. MP213Fo]|uniref:hypothetical protein n=1 Tax=Pseudochrobactrum sp. MP213Fo TaxID=3022250 RepID=UPI003BA2267C
MSETHSKSRQQAEAAFSRTQTEAPVRNRVAEEQDAILLAREEKTLRLREARLAKELEDSLIDAPAPKAKRTKKSA